MINTLQQLVKDYASYSFIEGKIDQSTMDNLVNGAEDYIKKLNELNLLAIPVVNQRSELLICDECNKDDMSIICTKCNTILIEAKNKTNL